MNFNNIITEIEKADPEVYDKLDTRRNTLKSFSNIGGKIALTALPFFLSGMFKKAYGQTSVPSVVDVLNYALTLEYLESEFYKKAVDTTGLIPAGAPTGAITTIRDHEVEHVTFLSTTITALGGTPVAMPTFDFTAGGLFPTVFSDYGTFLAVAQTFEDTGVRAYKGQAANANIMANNEVLTAALRIHSAEARHASHIRSMRRTVTGDTTIKPWITGNDTAGIGASVQAYYSGEGLATQAEIAITNINGFDISSNAATESFDEPLSMEAVLDLVAPFIV